MNIVWKNGLGNQLFAYSYGRILSKQLGHNLTYSETMDSWKGTSLLDYEFISEPEHISKHNGEEIVVNIDYNRHQAVDLENPHSYTNYLEQIKSWFPKVEKSNTDDLVVHLRLGDNGPNIHTPFDWYKKAIEDNEITFDKLYLITDGSDSEDAKSFKSYYNAEIPSSVNVSTNQDWKKYMSETIFDFNFIRRFDKIFRTWTLTSFCDPSCRCVTALSTCTAHSRRFSSETPSKGQNLANMRAGLDSFAGILPSAGC